jgi:hypothetical protein
VQLARSAAELGTRFPYDDATLCYIEVGAAGAVTWAARPDADAIRRARSGESHLYAVWPGQWSSHLFDIDDLDQLEGGLGIVNDQRRTGLADHPHDVR